MTTSAPTAAPVPAHRATRMLHMGGLAINLAGGMLAEGARRAATGQVPPWRDMLLTPDNAARLADKLSRLRDAAMKVGQLLSMEAGELLPPNSPRCWRGCGRTPISCPWASLLRLLPLLPAGASMDELLAEAKAQLRQEAD